MGILLNVYLLTSLGHLTWVAFGVWMVLGLAIYFGCRRRRSKLNSHPEEIGPHGARD